MILRGILCSHLQKMQYALAKCINTGMTDYYRLVNDSNETNKILTERKTRQRDLRLELKIETMF